MKLYTILSFLLFSITSSLCSSSSRIDVETPNRNIIPCNNRETPADIFRQCRNQGNCNGARNSLVMQVGEYRIQEGTEFANRPFKDLNTRATIASIQPEPLPFNASRPQSFQTQSPPVFHGQRILPPSQPQIKIQTPHGRFFFVSEYATPQEIFRMCRRNNFCSEKELELKYDNRVISEYSPQEYYKLAELERRNAVAVLKHKDSSTGVIRAILAWLW